MPFYRMTTSLFPRLLNVGLRSAALLSRLALMLFLAKFLEPSVLGLFGILYATVAFGVLFVGGDYYLYAQRELISAQDQRRSFVLQQQSVAMLVLYSLLLPAHSFLFLFDLLDVGLVLWFYALLISEHVAQEMFRVLNGVNRQLGASTVLFLRSGAWVWFCLFSMYYLSAPMTLELILGFWLAGTLTANLVGGFLIFVSIGHWQSWPVDWRWIKQGFGVGLAFFLASLCLKIITTADRYIVEDIAGIELVAVYTFYMGIAMVVINLLEPAVFSFLYPSLVQYYRQRRFPEYRRTFGQLCWSSLVVGGLLIAAIILAAPVLVEWLDNRIYADHLTILWILLGAAAFYGLGIVAQYGLYALGEDRIIVWSNISGVVVFAFFALLLANKTSSTEYVVPNALTATFLWIAVIKWVGLFKRTPRDG